MFEVVDYCFHDVTFLYNVWSNRFILCVARYVAVSLPKKNSKFLFSVARRRHHFESSRYLKIYSFPSSNSVIPLLFLRIKSIIAELTNIYTTNAAECIEAENTLKKHP